MYVAGLVAAFPDLAFAVKRISVDGDRQPEGTASVVGFFNQKTFGEQLGLQALIVFRKGESPLPFGMSVRSDPGNTAEPGALTMTSIDVYSDQEQGSRASRSPASKPTLSTPDSRARPAPEQTARRPLRTHSENDGTTIRVCLRIPALIDG